VAEWTFWRWATSKKDWKIR